MKTARYIFDWYTDPARKRGALVRPRSLNFPVTDNCNARCVMCDIWKENVEDDLSLEELRDIFKRPFFQDIRHVGISGGEPFLRIDLPEIVETISELPQLQTISITSHGFNLERHKKFAPLIKRLTDERGLRLSVNLSIDGVGDVHDQVRRVPGAYRKVTSALAYYGTIGVPVQVQCTVSKVNVFSLDALESSLSEVGVDTTYRLATSIERLHNAESIDSVALDDRERSFFADFLLHSGIMERTKNPARRLFYRQLVNMLVGEAPRKAPCYYQNEAVLLSSRGELFQCSIVSDPICSTPDGDFGAQYFSEENRVAMERVRKEVCAKCPHDQAGAWSPPALIMEVLRGSSIGARVGRLVSVAGKALRSLRALLTPLPSPRNLEPDTALGTAVIVGCYGGEHVGDAAILGGVLLRLAQNHSTKEAVVLSSRPDRTRSLIACLRTPVKVSVRDYRDEVLDEVVAAADVLVIGGGPIMDLPDLLARHIRFAKRFVINGLPVIAEGVGFGPFRRRFSRRLAARLLQMTSRVTFRSSYAVSDAGAECREVSQTLDPAFTYLESLTGEAGMLTEIQKKLGEGKPLVALNLRPLWKAYASRDVGDSRVKDDEDRIVAEFAKLVRENPQYNFLFLPLNSDQFGMSDLKIGNRLRNHCQSPNLMIWETEPSIDELYATLHACDAFVAMRFHACIFGLSAQCPTYGVDYGIGQSSKVGELFGDLGLADRCGNVSSLSSQEISEFLRSAVNEKVRVGAA